MSNNMELNTVKSINENLKRRNISVEELVNYKFDIIKKNENNLKIFITEDYDNAIKKAKELDSKNVFKDEVNILTGIPYGIKDNIETKDLLTTGGSRLYENYVPKEDAPVITKLKSVDAISLGKLNLDELGVGDKTISYKHQTKNPYNLDFDTNGSSGGSAAFITAGYGAFSLGSDTGGSVREPAGCCGTVGFKPTYDFIPANKVMNYAKSLDTIGVFANTVEDIMIATSAMSKRFRNHENFDYTDFESFDSELVLGMDKIKVGYIKEVFESYTHEEYTKVWEFLNTIKNEQIIELVELSLPEIYYTREIYSVKTAIEGLEEFTSHTKNIEIYGERINAKITQGKELLSNDDLVKQVLENEKKVVEKYNNFFKEVNIVATPLSSFHKDINVITLANISKTPAIALPLELGSNNVPVGLQLCGQYGEDRRLLRKAKYFEELIGFKNAPKMIVK